ncbi:MAG: hypothetical protein RLZZ299_1382 [Pseudomonadota bacterium]|jgi:hypothetical protein
MRPILSLLLLLGLAAHARAEDVAGAVAVPPGPQAVPPSTTTSSTAGVPTAALTAAPQGPARRIALVVGISSYERLPGELAREAPRADAARVAAALEQAGGYARVRLLTDASATRDNILSVIADQVARDVAPSDTFLLYFVGHGIGADVGDPRLFTYDTDPENLPGTSLSVSDLAARIAESVKAAHHVVLTDAAFDGQFRSLALLGPTANDWPALGPSTMVLSSTAPRQTAGVGVFARALLEGINGKADANGDRILTSGELSRWLVVSVPDVTGQKQLPTVQGRHDPDIVVAQLPPPAPVLGASAPPARLDLAAVAASRVRIDRAKFILRGGAGNVTCAGATPVTCDPSCYAWDIPAGPCDIRMQVDGKDYAGTVEARYRGSYTCAVYQGAVQCAAPPPPIGP